MEVTDVMVDLESTGVRSGYSGILQIGAVKFNLATGEVDPNVFDRCPALLPNRFWDEGTRDFWSKHQKVYQSIVMRQEEPRRVFEDFAEWVSGHSTPLRFWAKPITFDWPLLTSHFEQLGMEMPFFYRTVRDVNTFIAACNGNSADHVNMQHLEDSHNGPLHNALSDCVLQIKMVFEAKGIMPTTSAPIVDAEYEEISE